MEHQLDTLQRVGLTDIILVGGAHNLAQLQELAEPYKAQVLEQKNLDEGMAGAVLAAETLVGEESLLIFSSNDVLAQSAFEVFRRQAKAPPMHIYWSTVCRVISQVVTLK